MILPDINFVTLFHNSAIGSELGKFVTTMTQKDCVFVVHYSYRAVILMIYDKCLLLTKIYSTEINA